MNDVDPKDQEVIDALVNEVVLAVNMRLEAAAVACENVGNLGEGLDYAKVVREFKIEAKQINVVRT